MRIVINVNTKILCLEDMEDVMKQVLTMVFEEGYNYDTIESLSSSETCGNITIER